ncbi:MAG: DUF3298 domain-containing protein [Bacillota bacterium]|nr:DUF3298 domain-containing protein [Bacillota bacterium]
MKKAAAIILILAMVFALYGCHDFNDSSEDAPVPDYDVCINFSDVDKDEVWDSGSGELIFTQAICVPHVIAAGKDDAVEAINEDIGRRCELFREGAEAIKNAALSLADENAMPNGGQGEADDSDRAEACTCVFRTNAELNRGDVGVISISYDVYTYSGGVHGYVSRVSDTYDAKTGEKLSLETVSDEPELLNQLVYGYILNISAGEKYKDDSGESIFFNPDLTESISDIIAGDNWYFNDEGLVFYANPYELAAYSYGRVDFVVPYAAMDGLLKEKYVPAALEGENGMMLAQSGDGEDAAAPELLDTVTLDAEGQSVILTAEETVYAVQLVLRNNETMSDNFLWYRNYMTTDEAVELLSFIPDVQPNVILRYTLADGTVIERGISQSGEDGSIILIELAAG